jgi:hypothetical protein
MLAEGPPLVFAAIKETLRETMHLPVQKPSTWSPSASWQPWTSSTQAKTSWKAPKPLLKNAHQSGKVADYISQLRPLMRSLAFSA